MNPPPSVESYQNYIRNYDHANKNKRSLASFFMDRSHEILETSLPHSTATRIIVEVGSGTGHHFSHVKDGFSRYFLTDQSTEMIAIAKANLGAIASKVAFEVQDAAALGYPDGFCDRLIATHVLEHLRNPVEVLAEWDRVVKPGGIISLILPCDPGLLWRLGRHLGPRRTATAAGIDYDYLQVSEHVNYITALVTFIKHHFDDVVDRWYPCRIPWSDVNLFYICHIRK
jgi:phosphatidylethanolamine/phosphatidyl-N-methylethanolamine N-methyltransferase